MFLGMVAKLVEMSDIAAEQRHAEEREIDIFWSRRKKRR